MEFLKRHYEKVLLGVVLMGAAVGAAFLPIMIASEREALRSKSDEIINRPARPLEDLDLKRTEELIARASGRVRLDLSSGNKVFNSMPWKKNPDGSLLKAIEGNIGPSAVAVLKTSPLYTRITLDSVSVMEGEAPKYVIGVERQAAASLSLRRKRQYRAELDKKNDAFVIREVKGAKDAPSELVLEMNDTGEFISISREKPLERVDGYLADLRYDPERRQWTGRRVGDSLRLANEDYNIVAISQNEVVLSARSNNKKTVIAFNAASATDQP